MADKVGTARQRSLVVQFASRFNRTALRSELEKLVEAIAGLDAPEEQPAVAEPVEETEEETDDVEAAAEGD